MFRIQFPPVCYYIRSIFIFVELSHYGGWNCLWTLSTFQNKKVLPEEISKQQQPKCLSKKDKPITSHETEYVTNFKLIFLCKMQLVILNVTLYYCWKDDIVYLLITSTWRLILSQKQIRVVPVLFLQHALYLSETSLTKLYIIYTKALWALSQWFNRCVLRSSSGACRLG